MSLLDSLQSREGWTSVPFGRLVSRSKASGRPDLSALSVYLEDGVVPRASREDNHNRLGDDASKYLVVRPGDLVFNKLRTWQGGLGVSRYDGIVSPAYYVCRPNPSMEPRFLHYLFRSDPYLAELTRVSKFMPPSQFDIAWDDLRRVPIAHPAIDKQRVIADFLDTETARIDALIAKKSRLAAAVAARFRAWAERLLLDRAVRQIPLMYLTDVYRPIVYGIVQAGTHIPHGVPYLKSGDLTKLDPSKLSRTTPEIDEQYRRARVRPGDMVMAMRASIGQVITVPESLPRANLTQGTARIAAAPGIDSRWLFQILRTDFVQEQCRVRAVGTTFKTLNIWDLRRIAIPDAPASAQGMLAAEIEEREADSNRLCAALQQQVMLLREHRQALVTAVVTGELKIPGVAA